MSKWNELRHLDKLLRYDPIFFEFWPSILLLPVTFSDELAQFFNSNYIHKAHTCHSSLDHPQNHMEKSHLTCLLGAFLESTEQIS